MNGGSTNTSPATDSAGTCAICRQIREALQTYERTRDLRTLTLGGALGETAPPGTVECLETIRRTLQAHQGR